MKDIDAPSDKEIERFVLELLRRAGVRVHRFEDGDMGLLDVPARYVAVIDGLHVALISVVRGEGLPTFEEMARRPR